MGKIGEPVMRGGEPTQYPFEVETLLQAHRDGDAGARAAARHRLVNELAELLEVDLDAGEY